MNFRSLLAMEALLAGLPEAEQERLLTNRISAGAATYSPSARHDRKGSAVCPCGRRVSANVRVCFACSQRAGKERGE